MNVVLLHNKMDLHKKLGFNIQSFTHTFIQKLIVWLYDCMDMKCNSKKLSRML